jgi:hypothetical protein
MSRRHRPLGQYLRAAEKLAEKNSNFLKYVGRTELTPAQKSAIAKSAKLPKIPQRTEREWIEAAKRLSKFAPSLEKYNFKIITKGRKLNSGQKSAIAHKEKLLKYSDHLVIIPKRDRKRAIREEWDLYAPGIFAMPLRNTSEDARIIHLNKTMTVTSNGRTWLYWKLNKPPKKKKDLTDTQKERQAKKVFDKVETAATKTFDDFEATFDIEQIAKLAEKAFEEFKLIRVYLWAEIGRVGVGFKTLDEFMQWLYEDFSQYKDVERWVRGIAIKIADDRQGKDAPTPAEMTEIEEKRKAKRYARLRKQRGG